MTHPHHRPKLSTLSLGSTISVFRSQEHLLSSKHGVAASENLSPPRNFKQGKLWHLLSDLDFTRSFFAPRKGGWRRPSMRPCTDEWQGGTLSSSLEKLWSTLYRGSRIHPAGYPSQGVCLQPFETRMCMTWRCAGALRLQIRLNSGGRAGTLPPNAALGTSFPSPTPASTRQIRLRGGGVQRALRPSERGDPRLI